MTTPAAPKPNTTTKPEMAHETVDLRGLCTELKIDARLAREKLRIAARQPKKFPDLARAHKPRAAWEWPKGSDAEKQAREALAE